MHRVEVCGKEEFAVLGNFGKSTYSIRELRKVQSNECGYPRKSQNWCSKSNRFKNIPTELFFFRFLISKEICLSTKGYLSKISLLFKQEFRAKGELQGRSVSMPFFFGSSIGV
jgi:hypothetical protein